MPVFYVFGVAYMVTDFASFWIDSPFQCGGRWMEEKVTKR